VTINNSSTTLPSGEPVLYGSPGLHGLLYLPSGAPRARILLISPLFEEKRCAHRALATCARALAGAGAAVLTPDLSATGNSGGALAEITLARWLDDLRAADDFLRARSKAPLCLIGLRAGALLAVHAGLAAPRLLLWQPVLAGKSYLRQLRTRRMIQDAVTGGAPPVGPHEVEGQELSAAFFTELEGLRLPDAPPPGDICLLQCSFNTALLTEYARLAARWSTLRARCIIAEPCWNPHTPGAYADLAVALVEEALC